MSIYVEAEDVQSRYLGGEIPEDWLQIKIDEAEALLFTYFPRLEVSESTGSELVNIKRVVSEAIIRLFDNPRGMAREQIEEQSWSLASGQSLDSAGKLYFSAKDLAIFKTPMRRIGVIGSSPSWTSGYGAS